MLSKEYMQYVKEVKKNPEFEKKARKKELLFDQEFTEEEWFNSNASKNIKNIANHYGVFQDLFGDAYFYPAFPLNVKYESEDLELIPVVHRGNILKPSETTKAPSVYYNASPDSLWTLLLTTPDGNFTSQDLEYCHWFIGNIPGNDLKKGDVLVDYMRPIPCYGIGYCRYIFVLYKQKEKIDFSEYKKEQPCMDLLQRNWRTLDFYRKYQDLITPAGLAFFQADWDPSLQDFYHQTLQMKSPKFEYDFPPPYVRRQEWFPKAKAFNLYLDRYRNPKDVNQDYLLRKFKNTHPFRAPYKKYKYPLAHPFPHDMPTWLKDQMRKDYLGYGNINEIE
ncbi:39S ribosomal protein L38, mitochondrial isoform X2 [Chelonus insularis]|nr:39S ribosomal protein L38, mitochondrial isoform X2 [Chelonus insularis]